MVKFEASHNPPLSFGNWDYKIEAFCWETPLDFDTRRFFLKAVWISGDDHMDKSLLSTLRWLEFTAKDGRDVVEEACKLFPDREQYIRNAAVRISGKLLSGELK